jgi:hypothetical protein
MLAAQMQRKRKTKNLILPGSNFLGTIARFTAGRGILSFRYFFQRDGSSRDLLQGTPLTVTCLQDAFHSQGKKVLSSASFCVNH